jgi:hypothetical protein
MVEVAGLAYDAGLRNPAKLAQAVAVATAESGRDPAHLGDLSLQTGTWGPSVGLWQIRSLKAEKGKGTTRDQDKLSDPAANARAMMEISNSGSSWSPWTVTHVTNPAGYLRYQAALAASPGPVSAMLAQKGTKVGADAATATAGAVLQPVEQLAQTISEVAQTPSRIFNWLTEPTTALRIVYLMAGNALLVVGVVLVVRGPATAAASKIVQTVAPIGKAAKIVKKVT